VVEVIANSPAAGAGLAVGDALLSMEGVPLADHDDLRRRLQSRAGRRVELAYDRQGQMHRVALTLADDRPRPMPPPRIAGTADGASTPAGADASAAQRLEALERRVKELEARVQQLEAELSKRRGD
jgi:membrane-associated protease RseP (regulator of RpoE activity)